MKVEGRNFGPPAAADLFESIRLVLPAETPADYLAFLARFDGGQVWFDEEGPEGFDCLRIYSISRLLELQKSHKELFPSLLVIGGDQGSQRLGYDIEARSPWPLLLFLPGSRAVKIAASFGELERRYFRKPGENIG